ncbi:MAG TPA: ATP-binding protein [Steroidobacteraceae bacterium]|jgi:chemotaxis protein histidine kinase CheA|nr:ATP-binding protein [Steroidobacteraceae bacterium]
MFISAKRHEREKQELVSASNQLTDAILKTTAQGIFLLDPKDRILPRVSTSLGSMFRRQDFANLSFEKLIAPLVTAKTLAAARAFVARLRESAAHSPELENPLQDVEVRLPNDGGGAESAHYSFEFQPVELSREQRAWLVRVTDITTRVQQQRELEDLRAQARTQGEILRSVLAGGGARFGDFLQRTDAAMKTINSVLKKPAREADAFRNKLEETLNEVDRLRRDSAALKLSGLEAAARHFEDALQDLKSRGALSGSDFLPLAVKLDQLYGHFVLVRSLTMQAAPNADAAATLAAGVTEGGTQIIEAPRFTPEMIQQAERAAAAEPPPAPRAQRMAQAGSLESTLASLTELVAHEHRKTVVLEVMGMQQVPARYQATIKNVAIQLIRNAIMHGVEAPTEREAHGKPLHGTLRLEFKEMPDRSYELHFQDDGRGLDPNEVRAIAVSRGMLTAEEADRLRDRQAIKLIFKSAYSTLESADGGPRHGKGMSLVRRYVHEAGGKIALASLLGHETRFKIALPAEAGDGVNGLDEADDAQVA